MHALQSLPTLVGEVGVAALVEDVAGLHGVAADALPGVVGVPEKFSLAPLGVTVSPGRLPLKFHVMGLLVSNSAAIA